MGINYGYIRVSASDQNESRQLYAMEKNGIKQKNIFVDKQSGKNFERKQYKALLRKLKGKGQILRSTPNTAPLTCGACYSTQPEGLLTTA